MAASAPLVTQLRVTAARATPEEVRAVISVALDGAFYRAVNPDLQGRGVDPVRHYVESGWREGRDPAPWFSTTAYLAANPEVAESGWNPFHHFLARGRYEGREIARSAQADDYLLRRARRGEPTRWRFEDLVSEAVAEGVDEAELRRQERLLVEPEFDVQFYLAANPDVARTQADPVDHFLSSGWREGRDPNPDFSLKDYLESYPDIAAAGVNPFLHFLKAGRAEGRNAKTDLGFRYDILKALVPPEKTLAAVARASARLTLGTAAGLAKALAAGARTALADLHLTFSHDDFTTNAGGVQLCLQRESALIGELGRDHLHLFPAKPWLMVRTPGDPGHLGVLLNGKALGVYGPRAIAQALAKVAGAARPGTRSFAIHSLLGHSAAETIEILGAAGLTAGYFWLHDFASLCAGFHLLRNDVEDCAAPPADSQACGVCIYGPWRARHEAEHARLFERLSLTVVSPARPTLDLWAARSDYPAAGQVVLPHARLVARGPVPATPADRPLRVAYPGMPAAHKGWEIFRRLAARHAGDPRYHFVHLGGRAPAGSKIEFHKVVVTAARPLAMRDAVARHEADVAIMWPLCRETFSFAAYEAVAGGAAVVTGPDSGNLAAFVAEGGHGQVLPDEAALAAAFETGAIAELSRARRRPQLYDLAFSDLTVELLARQAGEAGA